MTRNSDPPATGHPGRSGEGQPPDGVLPGAASGGGGRRGPSASGVARNASIVIAAMVASRLTGFLRGTLLAYYFGQNRMTDAYQYAFTIPDLLWSLIAGGALYASFVPVISEYFANGDDEGAWKTFSIVFTLLSGIMIIVLPLLWIFAAPLLHRFAPDLQPPGSPDQATVLLHGMPYDVHPMQLAVHLTHIIIPAQLCFFLGSLLMGTQQSRHRFLAPALSPVIYNLGIIAGGFAGHLFPQWLGGPKNGFGLAGFAWGALVGAVCGSVLVQIWGVQGLHPRFRPSLDLNFPGVRKCGALIWPVLLGISLPNVDTIINGYFVSGIPGGRSVLDYTNRLMQVPLGIFGQAIGTVILPTLSGHAARKDVRGFKEMLNFGIRSALFLTVPISVLMIVLADPIIHVIYQHGAFRAQDTLRAIPSLQFYALGVPAWSAQAVIARGFYARQDSRTPVIVGTIVTVLFIMLNGFLVNGAGMGVPGAALATTIAATLHCVVLFWLLWRRIGGFYRWPLIYAARRIGAGCAVMAVVAMGTHRLLRPLEASFTGSLLDLCLSGGLGSAAFLGIETILGADEIRRFRGMLRRRRRV